MAKAYNRLEWDFLFAVLRKFGFHLSVISLIEPLITNCWFSVLFNGSAHGFFKSSRGLRQGDPIAPALFILAEEALSRGLTSLFLGSRGGSFSTLRRCPTISHLLYADDTLVFSNGSARHLRRLFAFLKKYEIASGQQINTAKSSYFIANNAPSPLRRSIEATTGFSRSNPPLTYLGVPVFLGHHKPAHFSYIL